VTRGNNGTKKIAPEWYYGSMTGSCFELWFEYKLLSNVQADSVIIMDRASFHRKKKLEEICARANINVLLLPPYAPDFNPIEKDRANMKRALRDTAPLAICFRPQSTIIGVRCI
jgi:transposase